MTYLSEKVRVIALDILLESMEEGEDARRNAAGIDDLRKTIDDLDPLG